MSHSDHDLNHSVPEPSRSQLANLLTLPLELIQSILNSITNFEPWMYSSTHERTAASLTDEDLTLYIHDSMHLNFTSVNPFNLGLSSTQDWLLLFLSRHAYCLTRSEHGGISFAITQALRRENARRERTYWTEREHKPILQVPDDGVSTSNHQWVDRRLSSASSDLPGHEVSAPSRMTQYHAQVDPEEAPSVSKQQEFHALRSSQLHHLPTTALIVYKPTPVLKLSQHDLSHLAAQSSQSPATSQMTALLAAVLITLLQCHLSLKENLEKQECDTPIPSIEADEIRDFATPKLSPRPDRPRSLSGSTVADVQSHEETLSFSPVATVYISHNAIKEVKWAEKRVSEEKEVGTSPKRPKLSEYKQVSSGRVATLMDRFEKFHL